MGKTESFHKRGGTSDRGKDYENLVVTNVVLQLVNDATINDFHISSKDKNFGALDDLVIKLESDKGTKVKAIHLKHSDRKTLSIENLKSKSGDFSISKYFESFQAIKNVADEVILFTNLSFDVDDNVKFQLEEEEFYIKPTKANCTLALSNDNNYVYQFQIIEDLSVVNNFSKIEEYKTFFNNFYLHTNQENFDTLSNTTSKKFKTTYSSNEDAFAKFIRIIWAWYIQEGKKEKLNKKWMKQVIALQLLSSQIEPLSFGLVNDKMKILRDAIFSFNITLFEKNSCETVKQLWGDIGKQIIDFEELNRVGRNYQLTTSYIDGNNIDNLQSKEFTQMLWLMNQCPLIVHECENVEKAIQLCPDSKFILLGESLKKEWMKSYSVFQNLSNLELKLDLREKILKNYTISIQEKKELNLMTAFGSDEDILESVTTDNLMEMLNGPCNIGGKKEILAEPYIERCLSQNLINNTYLEQAQVNTVIILNCAGNFDKVKDKLKYCTLIDIDELLGIESHDAENVSNNAFLNVDTKNKFDLSFDTSDLANTIYISKRNCTDFELLQVYNKNTKAKNIHYFEVMNDGNLEWIKSKGDVSNLDNYRVSNRHFKNENALWATPFNNNINLVTGDPGMGKSQLMKSLKNECSPKYWTVIVDPKDVNLFFKNLKVSKNFNYKKLFEKFIITENCGSLNTLDKTIFKICLKKNNILYVWDALDEILREHLHAVVDLIFQLSKKDFVQWVTSRQHLQTLLEKKFSVLSFHINQFSEREQQNYIRKRLTTFSSVDEIEIIIRKIKSTYVVTEHVDILRMPFQIFMFTELFRRDKNKYLNLLDNAFLLTDLYHYFIEEKLNIFYKDEMALNLETPHMSSKISEEKQTALSYYEGVALKAIFPEDILQRLSIDCQGHMATALKNYASLGILKEVQNNVVQFLHGSFAEYLVATYFSKNVKDIPADIIFDAKYDNVRFFFDMMMAKNSPVHIAVLYKKFYLLKTYDDETLTRKDEGGRTPLHLICSWGQRRPRVQVKCENKVYIVDDSTSINSKPESKEYFEAVMYLANKNNPEEHDRLLDMTPLSYARKSESLGAELKLLQMKQSELNQPCRFDDRINILYYSVLLGYDEVSELSQNDITFVTAQNGSTPLLLACEKDKIKIVEFLVKSGAKINDADNYGRTPLYMASQKGHEKTVEYLVKAGAEINRAANDGWTPLCTASFHGHEIIVQYLMKSGAEVNRATSFGFTPLYMVSQKGHTKIVECLVEADADINRTAKDGSTPLYIASQNGHDGTVEYLLKAGANINRAKNAGFIPLHIASKNGHQRTVEHLLKSGEEINRTANDGSTPLYMACLNGHEKIVEYLVNCGAEVNRANNDGFTPLYVASQNDHDNIVECLVKAGAMVNRPRHDGCTPLYMASQKGHEKTVECLLKAGAEIDHAKHGGFTPLYIASAKGHEKTVESLVKAGAEINRATDNGSTPLYTASFNGHEETVLHLLKAGAKINHATTDDHTPLFAASKNGHEKTVEYLVKAGAEINRGTNHGWTPLYVASHNGYEKIVECLVKAGAEINHAKIGGFTPLYAASLNGHEETVQYLLKVGAEINRADDCGATPLYVASVYSYQKTVECLVKAGAEINRATNGGFTPLYVACQNGDKQIVEYLVKAGAEKVFPKNEQFNENRCGCSIS